MYLSFTIHNSQKVESAQMFTNKWVNKQTLVEAHNEILLSKEKEILKHHNTDEAGKHCNKLKKPGLYNSIDRKCSE